jgi:hypothetical protein
MDMLNGTFYLGVTLPKNTMYMNVKEKLAKHIDSVALPRS